MFNYHKQINFPNGYAASVICRDASEMGPSYGAALGLFEVAVIGPDGLLDYSTPVTNDVVGWLDFYDVVKVLDQIKALPPK